MELLTKTKTEHHVDPGLESLHAESVEWLNEIDFWRDEMAFFYKLLHKEETRETFPAKDLAAVENQLIHIDSDILDKIKNEVKSHEWSLKAIMKTTSLEDEASYRKRHAKLLKDICRIHQLIRTFKRDVFSLVQTYD